VKKKKSECHFKLSSDDFFSRERIKLSFG